MPDTLTIHHSLSHIAGRYVGETVTVERNGERIEAYWLQMTGDTTAAVIHVNQRGEGAPVRLLAAREPDALGVEMDALLERYQSAGWSLADTAQQVGGAPSEGYETLTYTLVRGAPTS